MQGLRLSYDSINLELTAANSLRMDVGETTESRIRQLVIENHVVIFSRSSCCMCHVIKSLLFSIGAHPVVIELDDNEIHALSSTDCGAIILDGAPSVFVGGSWVGGLENLVALHLSGQLVPMLVEASSG